MIKKTAVSLAREGEDLRLIARHHLDEFIRDNIDDILNKAAMKFEEATTEDDSYYWAWAHWGATLSYQGAVKKELNTDKLNFYQKADDLFEKAIEKKKNYAWALAHQGENKIWLAAFLKDQGRESQAKDTLIEAKNHLEKATSIEPNYTWAHAKKGSAYRFLGLIEGEDSLREQPNYQKAIDSFTQAYKLNDKYAWALAFRAVIHRQRARALEQFPDLVKEAKDEWKSTYNDVEIALKIDSSVFARPQLLNVGPVFLPPIGLYSLNELKNEQPAHKYEKYKQLALEVYQKGSLGLEDEIKELYDNWHQE